jgi:hypothetical protein
LQDLADFVCNEFHKSQETITKVFRLCVYQLPLKIHYFAILVGLINTKNADIALEFVKIAADLLNEGLSTSSFRKVKLMVPFDNVDSIFR